MVADASVSVEILDKMLDSLQDPFLGLVERNPDSLCVQVAIKEISDKCTTSGVELVDPGLRKRLAVKLSLCELENTYSEIPEACKGMVTDMDFDNCVLGFQEKQQLWTTFSGNYRETFQICYYESLPFAKDQILGLYHNITRVYHGIYANLRKAEKASEETRESMELKLAEMMNNMNDMFNRQYKQQEEMKREYESYKSEVGHALEDSLDIVKDTFHNSNKFLDHITLRMGEIGAQLEEDRFWERIQELQEKTEKEYKNFDQMSSEVFLHVIQSLKKAHEQTVRNEMEAAGVNKRLEDTMNSARELGKTFSEIETIAHQQQDTLREEFRSSVIYISDTINEAMNSLAESFDDDLAYLHYTILSINGVLNATLSNANSIDSKLHDISSLLSALPNLSFWRLFPFLLSKNIIFLVAVWLVCRRSMGSALSFIFVSLSSPTHSNATPPPITSDTSFSLSPSSVSIVIIITLSSLLGILLAQVVAGRF